MRYLFWFMIPFFFLGCSTATPSPDSSMSQISQDLTYVQARVDGLSRPFCAYGLEKNLKEIKNVQSIKILFEEGIVTMEFPKNNPASTETIKKVIENAGFTSKNIEFSDVPFN